MAPPHRARAELKGGIFSEQQPTFVLCLVLPDLALKVKALLHTTIGFI